MLASHGGYSQAPAAVFANAIGNSSNDQGRNCVADAAGNVIVVGRFAGTVDFDPSGVTVNLTSSGGDDLFIAKYTSAGALSWAVRIGAGNDDSAEGVTVDASNDVYISGRFNGTADFNPGAGTNNLTAVGGDDIFVLKLSSLGVYQWAFRVGSTSDDQSRAIVYSALGFVYVTGRLGGATADFDPGAGTANLSTAGSDDIFVAKYSSGAGAYSWAFRVGAANSDSGEGITTDAAGNVYVTGYFQSTADFNPSGATNNLTSAGNDDIFLTKYDNTGAYQWAFRIGSAGGDDQSRNVVYSSFSNAVWMTGFFTGTADFDPSGSTVNLTSGGGDDAFVAKYNTAGTYLLAFRIGSTTGDERGEGIAVDANSNVYVSGRLQGTADFDPSGATANLTSAGNDDIYLAEYGNGGAYQMSFRVGSTSDDRAAGVSVDASGNMFITGLFDGGPMDFDPTGATLNRTSNSSSDDIFIAKYNTTVFLPVTLVDFRANSEQQGVMLNWTTASEKDNSYFTLQRSSDGITYSDIASIAGAGNSSALRDYESLDTDPLNGVSYYRLQQVDFDGNITNSKVLTLQNSGSSHQMRCFPNPSSGGDINLGFDGNDMGRLQIEVVDALGNKTYSAIADMSYDGSYKLTSTALAPGTYVVLAGNGNFLYKSMLIVR